MHRREFVAAAGATTTIAVAGCSSILGGGGGGNDSPEGAVEAIYDAIDDRDQDALDDAVHSESPTRPLDDTFESGGGETSVNLQSTTVTTEDPGEEELRSQYSEQYGEEGLNTIVDIGSNADDSALVEAELEFTITANDSEQSQTQTLVHFTAPEDGNWKVVV